MAMGLRPDLAARAVRSLSGRDDRNDEGHRLAFVAEAVVRERDLAAGRLRRGERRGGGKASLVACDADREQAAVGERLRRHPLIAEGGEVDEYVRAFRAIERDAVVVFPRARDIEQRPPGRLAPQARRFRRQLLAGLGLVVVVGQPGLRERDRRRGDERAEREGDGEPHRERAETVSVAPAETLDRQQRHEAEGSDQHVGREVGAQR